MTKTKKVLTKLILAAFIASVSFAFMPTNVYANNPDAGRISGLTIGFIEGVINQDAATITFNVPPYRVDNGRFVGIINDFTANDDTLLFFAYGQEWQMQLGDVVGFHSGDRVYTVGGVQYTLVVAPQYNRVYRLVIGGIEGVIDQNAATITFNVAYNRVDNGRFAGIINDFIANCDTLLFFAYGQQWPLRLGDLVGFHSGDRVSVAYGIEYTLVVNTVAHVTVTFSVYPPGSGFFYLYPCGNLVTEVVIEVPMGSTIPYWAVPNSFYSIPDWFFASWNILPHGKLVLSDMEFLALFAPFPPYTYVTFFVSDPKGGRLICYFASRFGARTVATFPRIPIGPLAAHNIPEIVVAPGWEFLGWGYLGGCIIGSEITRHSHMFMAMVEPIEGNTSPQGVTFSVSDPSIGWLECVWGGYTVYSGIDVWRHLGHTITAQDIPTPRVIPGWEFIGWDSCPIGAEVVPGMVFTAIFSPQPSYVYVTFFVSDHRGGRLNCYVMSSWWNPTMVTQPKVPIGSLAAQNIPAVIAAPGWEFVGWGARGNCLIGTVIPSEGATFVALFEPTECNTSPQGVVFVTSPIGYGWLECVWGGFTAYSGTEVWRPLGHILTSQDIPNPSPAYGWEFVGWWNRYGIYPVGAEVIHYMEFVAVFAPIE